MTILILSLLVVTLLSATVSSVGVAVARDEFDRLHYMGPVTVVGGMTLFLAVFLHAGFSQMTGKVAVAIFVLIVTGPVITHSIARAGLNRGDAKELRDEEWEVME